MIEDKQKQKQLTKWVVEIITITILIYLSISHIDKVASAVTWIINLFLPLIIGVVIALIINVPLGSIEKHLFQKNPTEKKVKMRRPLAICLSLIIVLGVIIGIFVLVVPEFLKAISVAVSSLTDYLNYFQELLSSGDYSQIPFGEQLASIDFTQIETELNEWVQQIGSTLLNLAATSIGSLVSNIANSVIGLIFSIYILANKEKLKRQVSRLIHVWLPHKFGNYIIHVAAVFNKNLKLFVIGQTTEAFILGGLCALGMFILQIPYAAMVGALVCITAFIPYIGAWIAAIVGAFMILTISPFKALVFIIFILILQQVEGNLIYPRVVGAKINLPSMWVLAAITIGGNLAGPFGMLFSVPVCASLYSLFKEATETKEQQKN